MRAALGAGRARIVRQMLTESLVLSSLGAVFGTALAWLAVNLLASTRAVSIPLLHSVEIDSTVLGFTVLVLVGAGLLVRSFLRLVDVDLGFRANRACATAALRREPATRCPCR